MFHWDLTSGDGILLRCFLRWKLERRFRGGSESWPSGAGRYAEIGDMVDSVFPPLAMDAEPTHEEFSSFNFWCAGAITPVVEVE